MERDELKTLIEADLELSKENNKLLKKIRGLQKRGAAFTYVRWLLVIAVAFGAYYYIQPYLAKITQFYNSIPNFGNIDFNNIDSLIKGLKP